MYKVFVQYTDEERTAFIRKHEAEWKETGDRIRTIRIQLRISQKKLAKAAGICDKTLRKLEHGKYITRFKTVSKSCINSLLAIAYSDLLRIQQSMEGGPA